MAGIELKNRMFGTGTKTITVARGTTLKVLNDDTEDADLTVTAPDDVDASVIVTVQVSAVRDL